MAGDDAVDAVEDLASHQKRLMEIPRQNAKSLFVCPADKSARGQRPMRQQAGRANGAGVKDRRHRPGEVKSQSNFRIQFPNPDQSGSIERDDSGCGRDFGAINFFQHFFFDPRIFVPSLLDLNEGQAISTTNPRQRASQTGDFESGVTESRPPGIAPIEPRAGVEPPKKRKWVIRNPPAPGSGPIQAGIVDHHRHAIRRKMDIHLNAIGALPQRQLERDQSIFRRVSGSTSMGDVQATLSFGGEGRNGGPRSGARYLFWRVFNSSNTILTVQESPNQDWRDGF